MKRKIVYRSSIFPAGIDEVFSLLQKPETLQYIAKPYASFTPIGKSGNILWEKGQTLPFQLKLLSFIPCGTHVVHVVDFSRHGIYTNESNPYVPVWNHRILLKALPGGTTAYSDGVEICAGWKTPFVWLWAKCFYAHRQKRWTRLLAKK